MGYVSVGVRVVLELVWVIVVVVRGGGLQVGRGPAFLDLVGDSTVVLGGAEVTYRGSNVELYCRQVGPPTLRFDGVDGNLAVRLVRGPACSHAVCRDLSRNRGSKG